MADTSYVRNVITDFTTNNVVDPEKFELEIQNSAPAITSANLLGTQCNGDPQNPEVGTNLTTWFDDPLSTGDETQFDVLVVAHDGVKSKDINSTEAALATTDKLVLQKSNNLVDEAIALSKDAPGNMLFQDDIQTTPLTLTQLLESLPPATDYGQVFYSLDAVSFTVQQPLVSSDGWLTNDEGILVVVG